MIFEESGSVELKEKVMPDLVKEVVAFANTQGGTIYVGVNDIGEPVGVNNINDTILQIKNMIRDSIKPDVTMFTRFDSFEESGKSVVVVSVQMGTNKPYYLASKGLKPSGVYVRNGSASDPSTDTAIRQMIRDTDGDSYESMRSLEQKLTFTEASEAFKKFNVDFGKQQMKTLGILNSDGIYTNMALLLSDQCPHTAKVAVFQGTEQTEFKDRREFGGSLFKQMEEVYDYIDMRNQTHSTFDKLRRIDSRDYPETALREAMLNSLVHRDYSFRASTLISIYEDRIEFVSIGGLLSGISKKDIMIGLSICRNPKLAAIFYRLQLIEAYGTGMPKIMNVYKDSSKKPKIIVTDNAFKIVLPNLNYFVDDNREIQSVNEKTEPIYASSSKNEELQSIYEDSSAYEIEVVAYIHQNGYITRAIAQELLGISQSTSNRLLRHMVDKKTLKIGGRGRMTKYFLN